MIHYQVISRRPAEIRNFTGTSIFQLKEAITKNGKLTSHVQLVCLRPHVVKSGLEPQDLDDLRKTLK